MKKSRNYLVKPEAERDLKEIGRYTRRTWGKEQAQKYLHAIHEKILTLVDNPKLGVMRDEVAMGYRSTHTAHHHIFYRVERETVVIIRVLHQSMDIQRHLDVSRERGIEVLSSPPAAEKRKERKRDRTPERSR